MLAPLSLPLCGGHDRSLSLLVSTSLRRLPAQIGEFVVANLAPSPSPPRPLSCSMVSLTIVDAYWRDLEWAKFLEFLINPELSPHFFAFLTPLDKGVMTSQDVTYIILLFFAIMKC